MPVLRTLAVGSDVMNKSVLDQISETQFCGNVDATKDPETRNQVEHSDRRRHLGRVSRSICVQNLNPFADPGDL